MIETIQFFKTFTCGYQNSDILLHQDSGLGHFKQPLRRHLAMERQHLYGADNGLTG